MSDMAFLSTIEQTYGKGVLHTKIMCSICDYANYVQMNQYRHCITKPFKICDLIDGQMLIYPTGYNPLRNRVVVELQANWKHSPTIKLKFGTSILDSNKKDRSISNGLVFEELAPEDKVGNLEVASISRLMNSRSRLLDCGRLDLVVHISVMLCEMSDCGELVRSADSFSQTEATLREMLQTPAFGDKIIDVAGVRYYPDEHMLSRSEFFRNLFRNNPDENGVYHIVHFQPSMFDQILIDSYIN